MADATNSGTPQAGGQLSGEVTRQAAVRRLEKEQSFRVRKAQGGPNTGPTGLPRAGAGLRQEPGNPTYSPHPPKVKRI
jgi:hypothetical protein